MTWPVALWLVVMVFVQAWWIGRLRHRIGKLEQRPSATPKDLDVATGFWEPFGTVRECINCGCLVAGGPTRCIRCAKGNEP